MTNPSDQEPGLAAEKPDLSAEIERSLGSIWQRRRGSRPASINTEIREDAIRCAIEPGEPPPTPEDADAEAGDEAGASDAYAFRLESIAAVTKITHRPVSAFIDKVDAKSGTAEQTFILDRARVRH
jgi:hypothetical protein